MATGQIDPAQTEAFVGRLFKGVLGAMELAAIYIGDRLGLYQVLANAGPATPGELARRAKIHERYAREWLEQQAVTGILMVDDPRMPENNRRYTLPASHAAALVDLDSPFSISPLARMIVGVSAALPEVVQAYRTGGGVSWSDYGPDVVEAQGDFNRPWLLSHFAREYLPSIPDIHARLQADPPARVVDIACGVGWSSIAIAQAYPNVIVHGLDSDSASIEIAARNATHAGVADRVKFEVHNAAATTIRRRYDLAIVIEAIHDMAKPVDALASIRRLLDKDGTAIVVDERVADFFTAPGNDVERMMYGYSITLCLPAAMAEKPTAATGTVMRAGTFRRYATEAGFKRVEVLNIEHQFFRFYRLIP